MTKYSLVIQGHNRDEIHSENLEVEATVSIQSILQQRITTAFQRPDAFVDLDKDKGTFTIGAGFWSKKGYFILEQVG